MSTTARLYDLFGLRRGEAKLVVLAFGYFFCLLASYYLLRPVRDEMGIRAGLDQLPWLFTATFVAMLALVPVFGWASTRFSRARLIPSVYVFFGISLLVFYTLFQTLGGNPWPARAFYVWVSVYNLFVVSVFWSFMTDVFDTTQAKRLFGLIASGGSAGAIVGPATAALLAQQLSPETLLPISTLVLCGALLMATSLGRYIDQTQHPGNALHGSAWDGITLLLHSRYLQGIALFIWLYSTLATFLYFQQAHIVAATFSGSADRTTVFASVDLAVNTLTVGLQLFATGRLIQHLGLDKTLALMPGLLAVGFLLLALSPVLALLITVQVVRRAGNYGLTRPARETLYTHLDRSSRYKAKNLVDTVVYRGSDAVAGWLFAGLQAMGLGLSGIALFAVPLAMVWSWLGWQLGHQFETTSEKGDSHEP